MDDFVLGRRYRIHLDDGEVVDGTHIMGPAHMWFGNDPSGGVTGDTIVVKVTATGEHRFIRTDSVTNAEPI